MTTFTAGFAGLPVADLEAGIAWYERLLGRPPDLTPNDREAAWQLAHAAWIYLVADPARAGRALVTLLVDDLDACVAELARRELATEAIETLPGAVRKTAINDPDGNRITLGEPLGSDSR